MQDIQTKYVLIIHRAIKVIQAGLTQHYGKHWELKIEGNSKGYWSIKWQQNDQGESFSISPE